MKIFFSGIGGSGVSALAGFASQRGDAVSGSDRLFDATPGHSLCRRLSAAGVRIFPQNGSGIDETTNLAVFSTAVEKDNPDRVKAKALGIPLQARPDYLSEIVSRFRTIAVAGTSGKSTMSGMLAYLMERLGMGPNFIGGGRVKQFRSSVNAGNYLAGGSELLVMEACESDGSLVNYRPELSIIANLALDHHPVGETAGMFAQLARNTSEIVIVGGDDANLAGYDFGRSVRFSIETESKYQAVGIEDAPFSSRFTVNDTEYELSIPGRHNVYNALASIACLCELGVRDADIAAVLPGFAGIERRFDVHLKDERRIVVDDYAHNPHKIDSLMRTMQKVAASVCYVFQPHGFGPTRMMKEGYVRVFTDGLRDSDRLVLLPIYYAGGTAAKDISSGDVAGPVKQAGRRAETLDRSGLLDSLGDYEAYVVFGARDDTLSDLAEEIANRVR